MRAGVIVVRAWSALGALCAVAFATAAGGAELLLAQPSPCPIGDELSFRAERALGEPLGSAAEVRCTVHITRQGSGFAARLEFASMGGHEAARERAFSAPNCEKLTDTLALAVVLAIGSGAASASSTPPGTVSASALSPALAAPAPEADVIASEAVEDESRGRARLAARAALLMDVGTLPAPAFGAVLGGAIGGDEVALEVLGSYLLPREASVDVSDGSLGAALSFASGSLLGCLPGVVRAPQLALGVCAGAELGLMRGEGTGVSISRSESVLWSALRADARLRWAFGGPVALELSAGALVPLERHEFAIRDDGELRDIYRPNAVVGRLSVGIGIDLD